MADRRTPGPAGVAGALVLLLAFAGCSTPRDPATTSESRPADRLESLVAADARVARVGYRLSVANTDLCPRTAPLAGWALHAAALYSPEMRIEAEARFALSGDLPGVLYIVPGGAAEQAGLQAGDLILAVAGRGLAVGPTRSEAVYEGFAANVAVIDAALAAGPTTLRIQRGKAVMEVTVTPEQGCGYAFQVEPSLDYEASADADRVFIGPRLVAYVADDAELAVFLGHELAHAVLNHPEAGRGLGNLPWRTEAREREADRIGLYLMARAGYDPLSGPALWRRFGADHWQARYAQWGHPSAEARARALEPVAAEIVRLRASNLPVVP